MDKEDILLPADDTPNDETSGTSFATSQAEAPGDAISHKPGKDENVIHHLGGMYQNWFLNYASYVILERAVPDIFDGLKPVQRRILHTMALMEDGRYNKVANIVGEAMKFHPHGDASIKDALVQLGQKELLIDTQGNWGNVMTADEAAASRYIEARLTKFALETLFSPKVTEWKLSYDGRNKEPVALPVKFPLLLAQGVEGIAVGLNSKILPHNFNELLDASVAYLRGEPFVLYPDFPTGGAIDVSRYNDGERGGVVKIRAKIGKVDNKTLVISEIPFGTSTGKLIESISRANSQGKIKVRSVDDNTAKQVEIIVHLASGVSSDKTIDALYAFTDCEVSVSPNCCVIHHNKPRFMGVSRMLRINVDHTVDILRSELQVQRNELREQFFFVSLEKIFIENRIYKDREFEESISQEEVLAHIDRRLMPFYPSFIRPVQRDDLLKLLEIRMKRITKFDSDKAEETLAAIKKKIDTIDHHLAHMVDYTISWFDGLKERYGSRFPRRTEIRNFESIEATKVIEATEKLYVNYEEGFIGTGLKKDEFVCNCSGIDDVLVIFKDGKYKIVRVADKVFVGKNILFVAVFKKNDKRTIYNVVYRDGRSGPFYIKRFAITGVTRDKEYDMTQGKPGSRVMYLTANPNGEAEVVRITLKSRPRLLKLNFEKDFSEVAIKGRQSRGNLLTKNEVQRITLKQRGGSTLGGRKVWFDPDVLRLNYDGRGNYLGEFHHTDSVLVLLGNGIFYTTTFDPTNHFENNILLIEKFQAEKVWTVVFYDADQKYFYLKRFLFEPSSKQQSFIGDNPNSSVVSVSDTPFPRFEVVFGGGDAHRLPVEVDAETFVGVKSFKARGKRLTTFEVKTVNELEPLRFPDEQLPDEEDPADKPTPASTAPADDDIPPADRLPSTSPNPTDTADDEGQMSLF